ncbi:MAG: 16S rRNA (uracil(1498)-N(3))-methyltransferase [Lachnospiraceae bacterium]|nr:16S rRNA (uracil(1498)-N(3))-methyltransferase [Lachnospiraceae bacterium]
MFQFFVEPGAVGEKEITITGSDVNHIKNVLRMKVGTPLRISNREDKDYICHISELKDDEIILAIDSEDTRGTELTSEVVLFQALPKGDKMETVIQKNVELGIKRIVPVKTKRCIVKLDDKKAVSKVARWQKIAEAAAKQSKRMIIPEVASVMDFGEAVKMAAALDHFIFPYENEEGIEKTRHIVDNIKPGESVGIFIGPEGGFEESEVEAARAAGAHVISMGKRILRTETAGMALAAVLMFKLEE